MTLDKAIERYKNAAEYERTHGSLQGCLDFRQLEEWLTDYKRLKEQEPFKPMVEIDLYSVIKQKYIERVVFDKIKAEIEEIETYDGLYIDRAYVLQIIDKYQEESEEKKNE